MKRCTKSAKKNTKKNSGSDWKLTYDRFKPAQEGLREALCTLGNGYMGTRGALTGSIATRISYPGTYIAGVYNKLSTRVAGRRVINEDLVNCPNWLLMAFKIEEGQWVSPLSVKVLDYRQELDMHGGVLIRKVHIQDRWGRRTRIRTERIVHMAEPHRAAISYSITPENYSGEITIRSGLDGSVQNTGVARYRQLNSKHLKPCSLGEFSKNGIYLSVQTSQSKITVAEAARLRIFSGTKELKPSAVLTVKEKKKLYHDYVISVKKNRRYDIEKTVSIYTSKDRNVRNPLKAAIASEKRPKRFRTLLKTHKRAWENLWKKADIKVQGEGLSQKALRLHTFHLLQTASCHNADIDAGLPARGLHGEAYRGHVFWDETFVMPFYDLRSPETSKALLLYRYRRLPQARANARSSGFKGAMFPWQSGSSGDEETQVIHLNPLSGKWGPDHSHIQRHVSFAVAYNVFQYWKRTEDSDFMARYGAEMLLSIARFGASLAKYDIRDRRYHTRGIMGPDEFHEKMPRSPKPGFKDNAYTNVLVVWTLMVARGILDYLPARHRTKIIKKLGITNKELARWEDITRKMCVLINEEGVISQFDGYFRLKELDWRSYRAKYDNIERLDRILKAEGRSPNDYKVSKQADVLMLFYLFEISEIRNIFHCLGYKFNRDMLRKNYEYYVGRTSHGSTLSKVAHCYVAHLLGRSKESWKWFQEVLKSDIYDTQGGTTPEGIHAGVMGGSVDIVLRGFTGIKIMKDRIKVMPALPAKWECVRFNFCFRGSWVTMCVTDSRLTVGLHSPKSRTVNVPVEVHGKVHYLRPGKTRRISIKKRFREN